MRLLRGRAVPSVGIGVSDTDTSAEPEPPEGTIDLAKANPFTRNGGFENLDAEKIRSRAEARGWRIVDDPQTNIESSYTTANMVLTRGKQTGFITLFVANDERIAIALEKSAAHGSAVTRRDATAVLVVNVKGASNRKTGPRRRCGRMARPEKGAC
ncbi:MAG: hypothetical protein ACOC1F_04035 [Myxococcota bacterium]